MKRLDWKYLPIAVLFVLSTALAPVFHAQDGVVTRVRVDPPDAYFLVDGTVFTGVFSAAWPAGSKHVLSAPPTERPAGNPKVEYVFQGWEYLGSTGLPNPATITASKDVTEYVAHFGVSYALDLIYVTCANIPNCQTPGVVTIDGKPYNSSAEIFVSQGASVIMQAVPSPGWVFVGWTPGPDQSVLNTQNTITVNAPMFVYPVFKPARQVRFLTDPPELEIIADRAPLFTPATLDWGLDTVHSLAPLTPQRDRTGKYWAFKGWSDGGAAVHSYKVTGAQAVDTVTATYVPAAGVTILTQPVGLPIKVDGLVSALVTPLSPYYYTWGVGEKHQIEAPLQQTDSQGRVWRFSGWSNGADAVQDFVVPIEAGTTGIRLTATYTQLAQLTVNSKVNPLTVQVDGKNCVVPCAVLREIGEKVRVSVPPSLGLSDGSRLDFDGWPGGAQDYVVTMTAAAQTIGINYHTMNRVTVTSDPPNGVLWRLDPQSNDGFYNATSQVAVSLTAQPGFRFKRWEGDLSGPFPSGVISMSAPRAVRAVLDAIPYIAPAGVANAAGATPSANVAAGSVISIFGANLATGTEAAGDGMIPQTLAGVTVRLGDRLLPLVFVSPAQINAVLPDDLAEGQQLLAVAPPGQPEVRATFTVARNAPGVFGTALHEDGSPVTSDAPARAGELLTIYGTGFGPVDHPRPTGFPIPASPDYLIADAVQVMVNDAAATVDKAFAAPGRVGIDIVRFHLTDGTVSGPLKVIVNGAESNSVTIAVQ